MEMSPAGFVAAQDAVGYDGILRELSHGRKTGHWMWFVFPQLTGLGASEVAERFAIDDLDAAAAYLAHPQAGERLRACVDAFLASGVAPETCFGPADARKLHACLTLFVRIAEPASVFHRAIAARFGGLLHPGTLAELD